MKLEKINIAGIENIYTISAVKKEFRKAAGEPWQNSPPWKRYQKKLLQDLAVLDVELEHAINLPQFEKLVDDKYLFSIRHPEARKNVRILYTIQSGLVILLVAFLENNISDYKRAIYTARFRLKWLERS